MQYEMLIKTSSDIECCCASNKWKTNIKHIPVGNCSAVYVNKAKSHMNVYLVFYF